MKSDGNASRAFCYLADAVTGFFCVLLKGNNGEAYNVSNDTCQIRIIALANILVNLFPEKGLKVIRDEESIKEGYLKSKISQSYPDISKIKRLGWEPKYSIEDGFRRTIKSLIYDLKKQ